MEGGCTGGGWQARGPATHLTKRCLWANFPSYDRASALLRNCQAPPPPPPHLMHPYRGSLPGWASVLSLPTNPHRRLYEETAHLLGSKAGHPLPNKLPAAYRQATAGGWKKQAGRRAGELAG